MPSKVINLFNADHPRDDNRITRCEYDEITACPRCHYALVPQILSGYYVKMDAEHPYSYMVNIFMLCPKCRHAFLAEYDAYKHPERFETLMTGKLMGLHPSAPQTKHFSPLVSALSPMFVNTYSQSEAAVTAGLMEIAGCGYRKSIEYLIKDYLCHKDPPNAEAIKGEFLGNSIKRIEDPRVKILAERTTWIGNDETHYVRKHENLDIEDMKRFIDALLHYVEAELTFEEALSVPHA